MKAAIDKSIGTSTATAGMLGKTNSASATSADISKLQSALKAEGNELKADMALGKKDGISRMGQSNLRAASQANSLAIKSAGLLKAGRADNARDSKAIEASQTAVQKALGYGEQTM